MGDDPPATPPHITALAFRIFHRLPLADSVKGLPGLIITESGSDKGDSRAPTRAGEALEEVGIPSSMLGNYDSFYISEKGLGVLLNPPSGGVVNAVAGEVSRLSKAAIARLKGKTIKVKAPAKQTAG